MSMEAKCKCNNCNELLAFPVELSGQTISCPLCRFETILFIPPGSVPVTQPQIWNDKIVSLAERTAAFKAHNSATRPQREAEFAELERQALGKVDGRCPQCSSDNTVKCAMAYQNGTRTGTFKGLGIDLQIDIGTFGGVETSQTLLASQVAPPKKESMNAGLILLLIIAGFGSIVCFAWLEDEDTEPKWPWGLAILACIGLIAYACYALDKDSKRKDQIFRERLQVYLRQWVCMRCGTIFAP